MLDELENCKKSLASALQDRTEAEILSKKYRAQSDKVTALETQNIEYRADKSSVEEELATTKDELAFVNSTLEAIKKVNSDLKSEARIRSEGLAEGWQTLATEVKWRQEQMQFERRWLRGTTVNVLMEYAQQFEQGNGTLLSTIKTKLVETRVWPNTVIAEPDDGHDLGN